MRIFKHVFFRQNSGKAIAESPLPPKTMINLGFQKDTCRGRRRIFQNFGRRSEKVKTKLAFSNPLFYPCIGGGGGHPGMALGFWGSEIGVARVGACLDYPHDRSRFFSKRRLSFLLGNEAL